MFSTLKFSGEKLYYKEQFGILESFEEVELQSQNAQQAGANRNEHSNERAIQLSNCTNIILLAFKVFST